MTLFDYNSEAPEPGLPSSDSLPGSSIRDSAGDNAGDNAGAGAGAAGEPRDAEQPAASALLGDAAQLTASFERLMAAWEDILPVSTGVLEDDLEGSNEADVLELFDELAAHQRQVSAALAIVAREVAVRSRLELGEERLTFKYGSRSAAHFVSERAQVEFREAKALVQVGNAIVGDRGLSGDRMLPRTETVAASLRCGDLGVTYANDIVRLTRRLAPKPHVDPAKLRLGEELLVDTAITGMPLPDFREAVARVEAYLDPDGVKPTLENQRRNRSLTFREDRETGMFYLNGKFDTKAGAYIKHALQSYTTGVLRGARGMNRPDGDDGGNGEGKGGSNADMFASSDSPAASEPNVAFRPTAETTGTQQDAVDAELRSIPQIQADALLDFVKHVIGCDQSKLPGPSTTLVVRMDIDDFVPPEEKDRVADNASDTGIAAPGTRIATIDGATVIDVSTARKIAATSGIIAMVLGEDSAPLDVGREARTFTFYQRLALIERDGGCAFCGLPPGMTEAHHIKYWSAHGGKTDLDNGVLLCTGCHHRVHEGWEIKIVHAPPSEGDKRTNRKASRSDRGGTVWFIPPGRIDAYREPRLGGRKRFDLGYRMENPPTPIPGRESSSWVGLFERWRQAA